jgi:hypothetical protein
MDIPSHKYGMRLPATLRNRIDRDIAAGIFINYTDAILSIIRQTLRESLPPLATYPPQEIIPTHIQFPQALITQIIEYYRLNKREWTLAIVSILASHYKINLEKIEKK